MPTNKAILDTPSKTALLSEDEEKNAFEEAKELIKSWGTLHAVRTVVGVAAFSLLIYKSK